MPPYRINVNWEWTGRCNARCAMCPRSMIDNAQLATYATFSLALGRLEPRDVYRCIVAGYGEPTTHPRFDHFVDLLRGHPVDFDLATNGSLLNEARLRRLDGVFDRVMISFSSIDPVVYGQTHNGLDQPTVLSNILAAQKVLQRSRLVINLSPTGACLDTLEATLAWFKGHGIDELHMSPTYYDRAGAQATAAQPSHQRLRAAIRQHRLQSQELAFVSGPRDIFHQWRRNRHKCVPRNVSLMLAASGDYTYCFNDITHGHALGNVHDMGLREALLLRERTAAEAALCDHCNLRHRYGPRELLRVAWGYARTRLAPAFVHG